MASGDGSVQIRISGKLDSSVMGSAQNAKATIAGVGEQASVSASTIATASQAAGTSIGGVAAASTAAHGKMQTDAVKSAKSMLDLVSSTVDTTHAVMDLGQKIASGDLSHLGSQAMQVAQQMIGLAAIIPGPFALAAAGIVAVGTVLVSLAEQQAEAKAKTESTTEAFALTGRGSLYTADAIRQQTDALQAMGGVTEDQAQNLIDFDAAHAEVNERLAYSANQLAPLYMKAWGDDAPQKLNNLKLALADLEQSSTEGAIQGFEKLNQTLLHFDDTQRTAIENTIKSNDTIGATQQILAQLAQNGGGSLGSLDTAIKNTEDQLKIAKQNVEDLNASASVSVDDVATQQIREDAKAAAADVTRLINVLRFLKQVAATPASGQPLSASIAQSNAVLDSLRDRATQASEAVARLNAQMEQRRKATPQDPKVVDFFAHQKDYDEKRRKQVDPGEDKTPTPKMPQMPKMPKSAGTGGSPLDGMEKELREQEMKMRESSHDWAQDMVQTELNFWKEKLKAAEGNAALYAQVNERYQQAELAAGRQGQEQARQIKQGDIDTTLQIEKQSIDATRKAAEEKFQAGASHADELRDVMKKAAQDEIDDEIKALNARKELYQNDSVETARIANEETLTHAKLTSMLLDIDKQYTSDLKSEQDKRDAKEKESARERAQQWQSTNQTILNAEKQLVSGIFSGRQTLGQMLRLIGLQILQQEVEADLQSLTMHKLTAAEKLATDQATSKTGLLAQLLGIHAKTAATVAGQEVEVAATSAGAAAKTAATTTGQLTEVTLVGTSEAAKVAAVMAGQVAQLTATEAGTTQKAAIVGASNMKEVTSHAATAAAAAYHAMAGIPIVGPVLGAAAAVATFAAVEAYGALTSFDKGTNMLPNDMIAQVHAGERIVPAADNRAIISALNGGGGAAAGGASSTFNAHFAPTVNGTQRGSMMDDLHAQSRDFFRFLERAHRDGKFRFA